MDQTPRTIPGGLQLKLVSARGQQARPEHQPARDPVTIDFIAKTVLYYLGNLSPADRRRVLDRARRLLNAK